MIQRIKSSFSRTECILLRPSAHNALCPLAQLYKCMRAVLLRLRWLQARSLLKFDNCQLLASCCRTISITAYRSHSLLGELDKSSTFTLASSPSSIIFAMDLEKDPCRNQAKECLCIVQGMQVYKPSLGAQIEANFTVWYS